MDMVSLLADADSTVATALEPLLQLAALGVQDGRVPVETLRATLPASRSRIPGGRPRGRRATLVPESKSIRCRRHDGDTSELMDQRAPDPSLTVQQLLPALSHTHLDHVEEEAIFVLREVAASFERPALLFERGLA